MIIETFFTHNNALIPMHFVLLKIIDNSGQLVITANLKFNYITHIGLHLVMIIIIINKTELDKPGVHLIKAYKLQPLASSTTCELWHCPECSAVYLISGDTVLRLSWNRAIEVAKLMNIAFFDIEGATNSKKSAIHYKSPRTLAH